jgi:uncharacterized protein YndB with AHSA1/START domain/DNA-binding transcriptional ArsR family regulator
MDAVFKALGDETRRHLLDSLRVKDGQTLTELEGVLGMTRFGVMKHLGVLEAAGLIVTRKEGRFKYHYLNVAPIQNIVDRWIEPLTQLPMTRALIDLKNQLEGSKTLPNNKPDFILETFIRATPERVWDALTKGEFSKHYYIAAAAIRGKIADGEKYEYLTADGNVMLSGKIILAKPYEKLEMTFVPSWRETFGESRNIYELQKQDDLTKLTILHFDLPSGSDGIKEGWAKIASSLKSFLETGQGLGKMGNVAQP